MAGSTGMEGQRRCGKGKWIIRDFHRISRGTVPDVISGIRKRKPARKNDAIIFCRKKSRMERVGTVGIVHMAGVLRVSGTAC